LNAATIGRELERIAQQIGEHDLEPVRIAVQR
jgi:hypothetical protein